MTNEDTKGMLAKLDETHSATNQLLKGIDMDSNVHTESDWRIRDIIGHISTWNRQSAKSLLAFLQGGEYSIPDLGEEEDDYNELEVKKQREWSIEEVLSEWRQSHEDFKNIIQEIPDDKYPGHLLFPWGEDYGSISNLVKFMVDHDVEHQEEISKALQTN